jgi:hypothetical protein
MGGGQEVPLGMGGGQEVPLAMAAAKKFRGE